MSRPEVKHNIAEYDVLRLFTTLLVVIGHCKYMQIVSPYGGIDYLKGNEALLGLWSYRALNVLVALIYSFHMQLFMALSGAIFFRKIASGKYNTLGSLLSDKWKRLMLPFFGVTFLYAVPIKLLSGYFENSTNVLRDIFCGQFLIQGNTHLWFLPTLFVIFIIAYIFDAYFKKKTFKIGLCLVAHFASKIAPCNLLSYVMEHLMWFYIGYYFEENRIRINQRITTATCLLTSGLFLSLFIVKRVVPIPLNGIALSVVSESLDIFIALLGCFATYQLCFFASKFRGLLQSETFNFLLKSSFAIYLFSDVWNYFLLKAIDKLCGIGVLVSNFGFTAMFIGRFVVTLILALVTQEILKKFRTRTN